MADLVLTGWDGRLPSSDAAARKTDSDPPGPRVGSRARAYGRRTARNQV